MSTTSMLGNWERILNETRREQEEGNQIKSSNYGNKNHINNRDSNNNQLTLGETDQKKIKNAQTTDFRNR